MIDLCDAKMYEKKEIFLDIFGEGVAKKQILHVNDCAKALITLMIAHEDYSEPVNVGTEDYESWSDIVEKICNIIDYHGKIRFNSERRERLENRLCDIKKLTTKGWKPQINMEEGLKGLCEEYFTMKRGQTNAQKGL